MDSLRPAVAGRDLDAASISGIVGAIVDRVGGASGDLHLFSATRTRWDYRFLLRDALQLTRGHGAPPDPDMAADHAALHGMLRRVNKEGLLRRDPPADLEMLSRSLFIVSHYWGDYLREVEGLERLDWPDQERGFRHHMAVLFPYLTASARRAFEAALARVSENDRRYRVSLGRRPAEVPVLE